MFLTNSPESILMEQAGTEWIKTQDPVILGVEISSYEINPCIYECYETPKVSDFEYECLVGISVEHILFRLEI